MTNHSRRILVAEDDEINMMIAAHILGKAGYHIHSVDNGESAVEAVREQEFDLILMDIEMPVMSGLEAIPLIRQIDKGRSLPIIAITAHSLPEKLVEIEQTGADAYIIKPFDEEKLHKIVDSFFS